MKQLYFIAIASCITLFVFTPINVAAQATTKTPNDKINGQQVWRIEKITYEYKKLDNDKSAISKMGVEMNAGTFIEWR